MNRISVCSEINWIQCLSGSCENNGKACDLLRKIGSCHTNDRKLVCNRPRIPDYMCGPVISTEKKESNSTTCFMLFLLNTSAAWKRNNKFEIKELPALCLKVFTSTLEKLGSNHNHFIHIPPVFWQSSGGIIHKWRHRSFMAKHWKSGAWPQSVFHLLKSRLEANKAPKGEQEVNMAAVQVCKSISPENV